MALCCFHHHSRFLCLCLLSSLKNLYLKGHLPGSTRQSRHQNQICRAGLSLLSEPFTMHPKPVRLTTSGSDSTPEPQYRALQAARQRQGTKAFTNRYDNVLASRDTLQSIRAFGLRQARYQGTAKVHLQHVFTATALNFARISAWLSRFSSTNTTGCLCATCQKRSFMR